MYLWAVCSNWPKATKRHEMDWALCDMPYYYNSFSQQTFKGRVGKKDNDDNAQFTNKEVRDQKGK